jgi:hypothetical protein
MDTRRSKEDQRDGERRDVQLEDDMASIGIDMLQPPSIPSANLLGTTIAVLFPKLWPQPTDCY